MSRKQKQTREAKSIRTPEQFYWPEAQDHLRPQVYMRVRRDYYPCPRCHRILLDQRSGAVRCYGVSGGYAYMRCHHCQHQYRLPVQDYRAPERQPPASG